MPTILDKLLNRDSDTKPSAEELRQIADLAQQGRDELVGIHGREIVQLVGTSLGLAARIDDVLRYQANGDFPGDRFDHAFAVKVPVQSETDVAHSGLSPCSWIQMEQPGRVHEHVSSPAECGAKCVRDLS